MKGLFKAFKLMTRQALKNSFKSYWQFQTFGLMIKISKAVLALEYSADSLVLEPVITEESRLQNLVYSFWYRSMRQEHGIVLLRCQVLLLSLWNYQRKTSQCTFSNNLIVIYYFAIVLDQTNLNEPFWHVCQCGAHSSGKQIWINCEAYISRVYTSF